MPYLAAQVDQIIQRMLNALPPGELSIKRTQVDSLITFSFDFKHIRVGRIEVEDAAPPANRTNVHYHELQVNNPVFEQLSRLFFQIDQAIRAETGETTWQEEPVPRLENELPSPRPALPALYEKICETTPLYFVQVLQYFIQRYNDEAFYSMDYIVGVMNEAQIRCCFADRAPEGVICLVEIIPVNRSQSLIRLLSTELRADWFNTLEIEVGGAFRQALAGYLEALFGAAAAVVSVRARTATGGPPHSAQPWELIPEHGRDRALVQLWCQGLALKEIGRRLHIHSKSAGNRLSELRRFYPQAGIPFQEERIKRMVNQDKPG